MELHSWDLQQHIFNQLSNNSELKRAGVDIYDSVPRRAKLPYISIADCSIAPNVTKTMSGENDEMTLNVWSAYKGKKEIQSIINMVTKTIYNMPLNLPNGANITYLTLENANVIEQEEEGLFMGVVKYLFTIR